MAFYRESRDERTLKAKTAEPIGPTVLHLVCGCRLSALKIEASSP